jgi:hypothetical protein
VNGQKYVMSNFNKRLTIKNLNTADNGNYVCTITRAANSKIHQATLTVIGKHKAWDCRVLARKEKFCPLNVNWESFFDRPFFSQRVSP